MSEYTFQAPGVSPRGHWTGIADEWARAHRTEVDHIKKRIAKAAWDEASRRAAAEREARRR